MASVQPIASAIRGVPASNFCSVFWYVEPCIETVSIMSPPPMNGCISSNVSLSTSRAPIPVGPHILWAENAIKFAPNVLKSISW